MELNPAIHQAARQTAKRLARTYFKNDYNQPFELTDGQADIFLAVFTRSWPRNEFITPTQYGKSDVISMALVLRIFTYGDHWAIVSGSGKQASIIMSKFIQHCFDHPLITAELDLDPGEKMDRLRRERSKEHITFRNLGEVRIYSADTRNSKRLDTALTGFGAPNIIEDEASLIPDNLQAMIMRMLGGHRDNFLLKIGNPFRRNHFMRTWYDKKYYRVFIDYHQALAEGRYTQDFIDEMKNEPFFDVLYECKFPDEGDVLESGYRRLLTSAHVDNAEIDAPLEIMEGDQPVLGVDVARGGLNQTVYVIRYPLSGFAMVLKKSDDPDLTNQKAQIIHYKEEYGIGDYRIAVDDVGVGGGLSDMLHEADVLITPVRAGEAANNADRFMNMKAELYWNLGKWIRTENGKLVKDHGFRELEMINYKESSSSKLQIEPKADLLKRGVLSPDTADALMLTFIDTGRIVDEGDIMMA